jgi:hypothetical protein
MCVSNTEWEHRNVNDGFRKDNQAKKKKRDNFHFIHIRCKLFLDVLYKQYLVMPRRSQRKRGSKRSQNGGSGEPPAQAVPQISQATLQQAGKMAQDLLTRAMSQGSNGGAQTGGSAQAGAAPVGGAAPAGAAPAGGAAPVGGAPAALHAAITDGAVAGAVAGAEAYSSLHGSPIMGGGRRRGRGKQSKSSSQPQKGGMIPGLMTAVETALVPLGLYLGQKALQSRRSGSRSLGKSFSFRRGSRRTRRRN